MDSKGLIKIAPTVLRQPRRSQKPQSLSMAKLEREAMQHFFKKGVTIIQPKKGNK